jgi:hypothetical protein
LNLVCEGKKIAQHKLSHYWINIIVYFIIY